MKILYTNFHAGDGGGHTSYLMALARGLARTHDVHVAAPAGSRLLREASTVDGVHAMAQPFPNGLGQLAAFARAARSLGRHLRAQAFDIVHVNGSADHRLAMAAMRGLPQRPRIVLTRHNSKATRGIGHWWRARHGTDLVIAVSGHTLEAMRVSPYRTCRLALVRNGVDLAHYAPWPPDAAHDARAAWPGAAGDDALVLGSTAGTADHKGWLDLVEAVATLPPERRRRVQVLLAGKAPSETSRQRVEALGLEGQVHFAGILADVRPLVAALDAGFVLSHRVETISFACREMMAMAKPVLVSDYAGLPENVTPGQEGWVVPTRDHRAIATVVDAMIDQPALLPVMGNAARRRAVAEFGIGGFVTATEAAYRDLLADTGSPLARLA